MSHQGPPPEAIRKLPVLETIRQANLTVFGSLRPLARAAALPLALTLGLSFTITSPEVSLQWASLVRLLALIPLTLFGVAWHRYMLLGPVHAAPPITPRIEPRHLRFLFFAALLWLIKEIPTRGAVQAAAPLRGVEGQPPPELVAQVLGGMLPYMLLFLVAVVLMIRFSFVFPAVSVDERYGFRESWRHTKGQSWRLVFGLILLLMPLSIVATLIGMSVAGTSSEAPGLTAMVVLVAIDFLILALAIAFVSIAFRECTGWIPAKDAGPPAPPQDRED